MFFLRSHLWDGTNTNTVDERTLENLAFLQERCTDRKRPGRERETERYGGN